MNKAGNLVLKYHTQSITFRGEGRAFLTITIFWGNTSELIRVNGVFLKKREEGAQPLVIDRVKNNGSGQISFFDANRHHACSQWVTWREQYLLNFTKKEPSRRAKSEDEQFKDLENELIKDTQMVEDVIHNDSLMLPNITQQPTKRGLLGLLS